MRFQIHYRWISNTPYRLHLPDTVISVRCPVFRSREELHWTWRDGTEYRLLFPRNCHEMSWHIVSGEKTLCAAHLSYPPLRTIPLLKALPRIQWDLCGAAMLYDRSWRHCGRFLRQKNGKRLAFWRHRRCFMPGWNMWFDGVWRSGLPESLAAILFGMILTDIHPGDYSGS